jgi:hypothetical protein
VGAAPTVNPDFYEEQAQPGDVWVLCSDGLTAYANENEIATIAGSCPPCEATRQFVEMANARGGRDNITAFVISVRALCPFDTKDGADSFQPEPNPILTGGEEPAPFPTYVDPQPQEDPGRGRSNWKRILGLG